MDFQSIVCVDNQQFIQKPTKQQTGAISKRITQLQNQQVLSVETLCQMIARGSTLVFAHFFPRADNGEYIRNDQLFARANTLAIDCDYGIPSEWTITPNLLYKTFSWTNENPRYRAIYFLDKIIEDRLEYRHCVTRLITMNSGDGACKDSSRLFFGSFECPLTLSTQLVNVDGLLNDYKEVPEREFAAIEAPSEGDEKAQQLVFAKMSAKERVSNLRYVGERLKALEKYHGGNGTSRYEILWTTTAILCGKPYLIPNVARQWVIEAVNKNNYFTIEYDRNFIEIIDSAYNYGISKRES